MDYIVKIMGGTERLTNLQNYLLKSVIKFYHLACWFTVHSFVISAVFEKVSRTDGPTDLRTNPLIEMQERI